LCEVGGLVADEKDGGDRVGGLGLDVESLPLKDAEAHPMVDYGNFPLRTTIFHLLDLSFGRLLQGKASWEQSATRA